MRIATAMRATSLACAVLVLACCSAFQHLPEPTGPRPSALAPRASSRAQLPRFESKRSFARSFAGGRLCQCVLRVAREDSRRDGCDKCAQPPQGGASRRQATPASAGVGHGRGAVGKQGTRTLDGLQGRWGLAKGGQGQHQRGRLAALSTLRARGEGTGADDLNAVEKLDAACEAYPQRWRVEGAVCM
jgi:hypothetical protein